MTSTAPSLRLRFCPSGPALVMLLLGQLGWAASSGSGSIVVVSGRCNDARTQERASRFSEALRARGVRPQNLEPLLARIPREPVPLEELHRQLDAARTHFYSARYMRATETGLALLEQLRNTAANERLWRVQAETRILLGQIARHRNRLTEAQEHFAGVLRLEPNLQLDLDQHTPATRTFFEEARAKVKSEKKRQLSVRTTPVGAQVYVEGAPVGRAPLSLSLSEGNYLVQVSNGDQHSLLHPVALSTDVQLTVDLPFEGAIQAGNTVCLEEGGAQGGLEFPFRLGVLAEASELLLLRNERAQGQDWVTAVRADIGRGAVVREGGVKLAPNAEERDLLTLADFLVTGRVDGKVQAVAAGASKSEPAPKPSAQAEASAPLVEPASAVTPALVSEPPSPPPLVEALPSNGRTWMRPTGLTLVSAGVLVALGSGVVWMSGSEDRAREAELLGSDGLLPAAGTPEYSEARALVQRTDDNQKTSLLLAASGGVLGLVGGGLLFLAPKADTRGDEGSPRVTARLTGGGGELWVGADF